MIEYQTKSKLENTFNEKKHLSIYLQFSTKFLFNFLFKAMFGNPM